MNGKSSFTTLKILTFGILSDIITLNRFKGPLCLGPLAALFILLIILQLLFYAKKNREVVNMTNNFFFESLSVISSHLAAVSGPALLAAAMVP